MIINISAGGGKPRSRLPIIKEKGELMRHFRLNLADIKAELNIKKLMCPAFLHRAAALAVMVTVTVLSVVTVMAKTNTAHIVYNGKKTDVQMTSAETKDILFAAGIETGSDDIVVKKDASDGSGDVVITVKSAYGVTVDSDGTKKTVAAHYGDKVSSVLEKAGTEADWNDVVTPAQDSTVTGKMAVSVKKRCGISLTADGSTVSTVVNAKNVADAIKEAGFSLGKDDTVNAGLDSAVTEGQKLEITRVAYKDVTTTEPVAFKTVTEKSKALSAGKVKVVTQGQNGVKTTVTRQKLVNGQLAGSTVVSSAVTKEPVNKVVSVGAKGSAIASVGSDGTFVDHNGKSVSYKKLLTGRCSCYCTGTTTSTGLKAAYGRVAVNPNVIPYGTKLYICSPDGKVVYGYAVAADTGGAAMRGSIIADLYYSSYSQCMKIGTRTMNVYVL